MNESQNTVVAIAADLPCQEYHPDGSPEICGCGWGHRMHLAVKGK